MSLESKNPLFCKNKSNFKKSSKFIEDDLIVYREDLNNEELYEVMKKGYKDMGKINLEISVELDFSQNSTKFKYDTFNEYEKWLCGV